MAYERFRLPLVSELALDRAASQRWLSQDGHLHVGLSNISASRVNPYWGHEIPDSEKLGLDPEKKYMLWRHPDELRKGAPTFNRLQILADHVPVTADSPQPKLVIGATGSDARYNHPYLQNSLVFWTQPAIDAITSGKQRELSCGYHYDARMAPGTTPGEGLHYDGIMTNLHGQHVALVEDGRAGADVIVADALPDDMYDREWLRIAAAIRSLGRN